jgi:hypothetical protein
MDYDSMSSRDDDGFINMVSDDESDSSGPLMNLPRSPAPSPKRNSEHQMVQPQAAPDRDVSDATTNTEELAATVAELMDAAPPLLCHKTRAVAFLQRRVPPFKRFLQQPDNNTHYLGMLR